MRIKLTIYGKHYVFICKQVLNCLSKHRSCKRKHAVARVFLLYSLPF